MQYRLEQGGLGNFLSQGTTETCRVAPTYLARRWAGVRVRATMRAILPTKINAPPDVCQRLVLRTNPKGSKTECVFADGTAIMISNFLACFTRAGDELRFPIEFETPNAGTQIYIRNTNREERRRDVFQAEIGYAT